MSSYRESAEHESDEPRAAETPGCSSTDSDADASATVRAVVRVKGNVQGVGFRPFLYQLATEHGLRGCVVNSASGVDLEIEGPRRAVHLFLADISQRRPPLAVISEIDHHFADPVGHPAFVIGESEGRGRRTAQISPDVAVCDDCLRELFNPADRRYRYPMINCTNCGPRYTIISEVPYDRPSTTMACFAMCPECQREYDDPMNRRFHAQPNACPKCGPRIWLAESIADTSHASVRSGADGDSAELSSDTAIDAAVGMLCEGRIVAVKGLGGFHLACDATNGRAVAALRHRKGREEKPFAVMIPDLETARRLCHVDADAESLLSSRERPIALLPKRDHAEIAEEVAPGGDYLGLMLPYTPLHYLLMFDANGRRRFNALVMTSGNRGDEPIAIGNREALRRLAGLADAFLLHDRDIKTRVDDSVVAHVRGQQTAVFLRRSRGYVPSPVFLNRDVGEVLAVGGHMKNTIAISRGKNVFLSQHVGDLENFEAVEFLRESVEHLRRILDVRPLLVAHDLHPDYPSTRYALQLEDCQHVAVQHHHAHVASCMAEHALDGPVIGVALDGTGYGADGNVWGGEILIADYAGFQRAAHFRETRLLGNEKAIEQPWRMALSHLDVAYGDGLWALRIPFVRELDRATAELLLRAGRRAVNSPPTSSCGRLFDAVAALVGLRQAVTFEGQAAAELETAMMLTSENKGPREREARASDRPQAGPPMDAESAASSDSRFHVVDAPGYPTLTLDTSRLIRAVVDDIRAHRTTPAISQRFHRALVAMLVEAVSRVAEQSGLRKVVLSGGCFQNRYLQSELAAGVEALGLSVHSHRLVPPNDGGLALGQVVVAAAIARRL